VLIKGVILCLIVLSLPFLFKEAWKFASPGLKLNEQKFTLPSMFSGTFFFIAGASMAYFFVATISIKWFIQLN
jgi:sec-independent protein translocase protein TatC